jgi:hypothetical protein
MFNKIKPLYFFSAFIIGLIIVYFTTPPPVIVMKFPSPYNSGKVNYKDEHTDACYYYESSQETCPADTSLVKPQVIGSNSI